jgi:hypothetical protein
MQNYNLKIVHAEAGVSSEDSLWVHLKMLQSNVSSALCAAASIRDRLESLQRNGTLINKSVVGVEGVNNVVESVGESSSSSGVGSQRGGLSISAELRVVDGCGLPTNLGQLTTQETNSPPPVNGLFFVIDESDCKSEEEETVDEGSLPVQYQL